MLAILDCPGGASLLPRKFQIRCACSRNARTIPLDVAQAEVEAHIPANRATDDDRRKPVTVIGWFDLLHSLILRSPMREFDKARVRPVRGIEQQKKLNVPDNRRPTGTSGASCGGRRVGERE